MPVTFEHRGESGVVVRGVDTTDALRHLCRSLEVGTAPDARVVVIDLSGAPIVAQESQAAISVTASALGRSRRWLGVVEPLHAAASGHSDGWYTSVGSALNAGARYLALMRGEQGARSQLAVAVRGMAGVVSWAPQMALNTVRAALRRLV